MADQITAETLVSLGCTPSTAATFVAGKEKGRGKKQYQLFASLFELASKQTDAIGTDKGKLLFKAGQTLPDDIAAEGKQLFIESLFAPTDQSIEHPVKFASAITFISKNKAPYDVDAFKTASGIGVAAPSQAEVNALVDGVINKNEADIKANLYPYEGRMLGQMKRVKELTYADLGHVTAAVQAGFLRLLGPKTPENTKPTKQTGKKKDGKGAKAGAKANKPDVAGGDEPQPKNTSSAIDETPTDAPLSAKAAEEEHEKKRQLLTAVALKYGLDVGDVIVTFLKGAGEETGSTQTINPITVDTGAEEEIDYDRLIREFGTNRIPQEMLDRIQRLTGKPAHPFLTRGIFFSHRDLDLILDSYEAKKPFYLYTGRGPSSDSMHLGHLIPFLFTKYLQDTFGAVLVIQMTDDEKYLWKDLTLDKLRETLIANVKDIIACGFDREKTFIFSNFNYMGGKFYENIVQIQKRMTGNQAMNALGLSTLDNIGKFSFSAIQAAPSFSSSFPHIFGPKSNYHCLIPCAIDQDVYFRLTRGIADRLNLKKPAVIHSRFFPGIDGGGKMSSSVQQDKTIFLTDSMNMIKSKVNKYAFSGARGKGDKADTEKYGVDLDKDVPYQYLTFFLHDQKKLDEIKEKYAVGQMLTGEVKKVLIDVLQELVQGHQTRKAAVTDEEIAYFMSTDPSRFN